jgi:hypothetical protein
MPRPITVENPKNLKKVGELLGRDTAYSANFAGGGCRAIAAVPSLWICAGLPVQ